MGKEKPTKRTAGSKATEANVEDRLATARLSKPSLLNCIPLFTCGFNNHNCPGLGICDTNGGRAPTCKTNNPKHPTRPQLRERRS